MSNQALQASAPAYIVSFNLPTEFVSIARTDNAVIPVKPDSTGLGMSQPKDAQQTSAYAQI